MARDKGKEKGHGQKAVKVGDKYLCPHCHVEVPVKHDCPACKLEIDWTKV